MKNFTYHNPTKIIFGEDTSDHLIEEMQGRGKNVLLVYGGNSIKRNRLIETSCQLDTVCRFCKS